jgi:cyanophycinase-like exopeptidase
MMAEGYERGFGFLPGTAIDQHFSQRGRKPDLVPVVRRHPRMLGIGIDEGTALVVRGHTAEVLGDHAAHFLLAQRLQALTADELATLDADAVKRLYVTVESGASVDLSDPASGPARQ